MSPDYYLTTATFPPRVPAPLNLISVLRQMSSETYTSTTSNGERHRFSISIHSIHTFTSYIPYTSLWYPIYRPGSDGNSKFEFLSHRSVSASYRTVPSGLNRVGYPQHASWRRTALHGMWEGCIPCRASDGSRPQGESAAHGHEECRMILDQGRTPKGERITSE